MKHVFATDSSIIVKWFKADESYPDEAAALKEALTDQRATLVTTELLPLEVSRAITKAGASRTDVEEVRSTLSEFYYLHFMRAVETNRLTDKATELIHAHSLYVIDALTVALAINERVDLVTEDKHLLKPSLAPALREAGIRVRRLKDI